MGRWWVIVVLAAVGAGAGPAGLNDFLDWDEADFNRGPPPRGEVVYSREEEACLRNRTLYHMGRCRSLLERGDCGEGEWLVVDGAAAGVRAVCREVPCPSGQAYWEESRECVPTEESARVCTRRETALGVDTLGRGECGCKKGKARVMAPSGACYLLYSRGPCGEGKIVAAEDDGAATCAPDPCPSPASDLLPFAGGCHPRGERGPCPQDTLLQVDVTLLAPACAPDINQWHLVDAPVLCTDVDHLGNCRNRVDVAQAQRLSFLQVINRDKAKRRKRNGVSQ